MKNKEEILSKIQDKDSKFLASKVLDAYFLSDKAGCQVVTDFLTPVFLSSILSDLERYYNLFDVVTYGGFDDAERRCIVFNSDDIGYYEIEVLKISTNTKFNKSLEHRAVLGSILGLGINRSKVGDIVFENDVCYVFVKNEILDYIIYNLEFVGKSKVKVEQATYTPSSTETVEQLKTTTVSSLRVDTIVASVTNNSRSEVKKLFEKELVLINWRVCDNSSYIVKEGDIITVRKFGRIKLEKVKGLSKKGKYIIEYY